MLACFVLALAIAVWSVEKISLSPFGLQGRGKTVAAATLSVEVDSSKSSLVDLRENTNNLELLTNRAILIGSVMASTSVRTAIARRAGVSLGGLLINAPQATGDSGAMPDQSSIRLRANATVPMLDIATQASDVDTAQRLAEAAVSETQAYLTQVATSEKASDAVRLRLVPLGQARGSEISHSVTWRTPLFAFLITFGIGCATLIFVSRVRSELRLAKPA